MKNERLRTMVKLAMLVALLAIFCFTPLGFLKIGIVEITFNMIPVIIGAIAVGPAAGAVSAHFSGRRASGSASDRAPSGRCCSG